ncbi:hypothetical protein SacmaDRAFT_3864 [Saccharomonospora marina XMU15]|uniref:Uncharacterized protein n=1 Tax=Saccharomonospora marina XMU15 TaxID=882083 RepID=H5X1Z6_9PSEU|nr:hypothetical protein [Saccharomonospora marina]EHR52067.1 hypothetical protein SacmaDRAFT_3864 [Saccharomonospora marina XMU15]
MTANDAGGTRLPPRRREADRELGKPVVVLLTVLTLANVYAMVSGVALVADEFEHGSELDDLSARLAVLSLAEAVVSLGFLTAVWLRQLWGVHAYLAVKVVMVLLISVAARHFVPLALLPTLLGVLLWAAVHHAGWRPRDPRW